MNCTEFKNIMFDYLGKNNQTEEFEKHLENCPACRAEFEQMQSVVQSLKPDVDIRASDDFVNKVITQLKSEDIKMKKKMPLWSKIAAAIVGILLISSLFVIIVHNNSSSQVSANTIPQVFEKSIASLSDSKSMHIEMDIRTVSGDNFELIGTNLDFVKNHIKTVFSSPQKWRIEKPGRTVICDGKNQYMDINGMDFILQGPVNSGFVEWLKIFLTPDKILEMEKQQSEQQKSDYTMQEDKNQIILTATYKAQGDFTHDYLKNKSVTESDNKRVFCFDKETYRLLSFKLYIIQNKKEKLVMQTTKITYDEAFDSIEFDVQSLGKKPIKNVKDLEPKADESIKNMTPEQTARYFFEGCSQKDWEKVAKVCPYLNNGLKEILGGVQIIKIGKSFKSGTYKGVFVPYTIKFTQGPGKGQTRNFNLALRNDNKEGIWVFDGGI